MKTRSSVLFGGWFEAEHWRQADLCSPILLRRPGVLIRNDRVLLARVRSKNIVVNQGLNYLLNVGMNAASQVATWYVSTFEGNYTPLAADTAATFPASSTECTAYDEASRPEYVEVASTAQSLTNAASRATFTYNATKTIYGASLHSVATKSAVTGTLLAAARFGTSRAVVATDELLVSYTINAASA